MLDFVKDLAIDHDSLDIEWLQQPQRFFTYAEVCAEARLEMDKAKEAVDTLYAQLDIKIRERPDEYGLSKVTEKAVENIILIDKAYGTAKSDFHQKKYEYDMACNAVKAMEQRKEALEALVKLGGMNYFAMPAEPRNLAKQLEETRQDREEAFVNNIKNRKEA